MNSDSLTTPELKLLHSQLGKILDEQNKNWKHFTYAKKDGFYQGLDIIKINGARSTEKRFMSYNIENYLTEKTTALDIGCNCGFFSIYLTKFLHSVTGIDINPYMIDIANSVQNFLKINNSEFVFSSFENFETTQKFGIIFSLANDETIDGNTKFNFNEYVSKILSLLNDDGLLMFETMAQDTFEPKLFEPKLKILKTKFTILEDKLVDTEYPINVPQRRFLILKK